MEAQQRLNRDQNVLDFPPKFPNFAEREFHTEPMELDRITF